MPSTPWKNSNQHATRTHHATGKKVSTIIGPDAWKNFGTETRKTFYDNNVTLMTFSYINVYSSSYTAGRKFYIDTFGKVPDTDSQRMFFTGLDVVSLLHLQGGKGREPGPRTAEQRREDSAIQER